MDHTNPRAEKNHIKPLALTPCSPLSLSHRVSSPARIVRAKVAVASMPCSKVVMFTIWSLRSYWPIFSASRSYIGVARYCVSMKNWFLINNQFLVLIFIKFRVQHSVLKIPHVVRFRELYTAYLPVMKEALQWLLMLASLSKQEPRNRRGSVSISDKSLILRYSEVAILGVEIIVSGCNLADGSAAILPNFRTIRKVSTTRFRTIDTLRDVTIRCLTRYWNTP